MSDIDSEMRESIQEFETKSWDIRDTYIKSPGRHDDLWKYLGDSSANIDALMSLFTGGMVKAQEELYARVVKPSTGQEYWIKAGMLEFIGEFKAINVERYEPGAVGTQSGDCLASLKEHGTDTDGGIIKEPKEKK